MDEIIKRSCYKADREGKFYEYDGPEDNLEHPSSTPLITNTPPAHPIKKEEKW
jgi:hypothetical protein